MFRNKYFVAVWCYLFCYFCLCGFCLCLILCRDSANYRLIGQLDIEIKILNEILGSLEMALNYIVTAYKPTVVTHALVGSFIVPTELNLVLAKTNRVELFLVTPEGLKPHRECPVFGRIATIKLFRAPGEVWILIFYISV